MEYNREFLTAQRPWYIAHPEHLVTMFMSTLTPSAREIWRKNKVELSYRMQHEDRAIQIPGHRFTQVRYYLINRNPGVSVKLN